MNAAALVVLIACLIGAACTAASPVWTRRYRLLLLAMTALAIVAAALDAVAWITHRYPATWALTVAAPIPWLLALSQGSRLQAALSARQRRLRHLRRLQRERRPRN